MKKIKVFENRHETALPISIIVPLQDKRMDFFTNYVLPLLQQSGAREVIVNNNPGNAAQKRNEGFKHATQPFVCFVDDDKLLPRNYLLTLYQAIKQNPKIDFVYTGYTGIVLHPDTHPCKNNYQIHTRDFDLEALKRNNYIDTTSLIRKDAFPGFDEMLPQHDDWDMYLNMATRGFNGKAVHGLSFFSFFLDEGLTSVNNQDCSLIIRNRYK